MVRQARPRRPARDLMLRARRVRLVLLEADGVLTDGRILVDARGRELTTFHAHDGYGISLLLHAGIKVAFVSARRSPAVAQRGRELRVSAVLHAVRSPLSA